GRVPDGIEQLPPRLSGTGGHQNVLRVVQLSSAVGVGRLEEEPDSRPGPRAADPHQGRRRRPTNPRLAPLHHLFHPRAARPAPSHETAAPRVAASWRASTRTGPAAAASGPTCPRASSAAQLTVGSGSLAVPARSATADRAPGPRSPRHSAALLRTLAAFSFSS